MFLTSEVENGESGTARVEGTDPIRFAALRHSGAAIRGGDGGGGSGGGGSGDGDGGGSGTEAKPRGGVRATSARLHPLLPESVGCQARREPVVPGVYSPSRPSSLHFGCGRSIPLSPDLLLSLSLLSFACDRYSESVRERGPAAAGGKPDPLSVLLFST